MPRIVAPPRPPPPLGRAFWGAGVAGSALLALPLWLVLARGPTSAVLALLALFAGYTAWALRLVWRSAPGARDPVLGRVARALVIAWALNVALLVPFLAVGRLIAA